MSDSSFVSVYLISWYGPRLRTDLSAAERIVRTLKLDHGLVNRFSRMFRVSDSEHRINYRTINLQADDLIQ